MVNLMDKQLPSRKFIRLKNYDYSQPGFYFVTVCTENRIHRFGDIICGNMQLNQFGIIVTEQWNDLPNRFSNIQLDQFITMPNHIHGIIHVGAPLAGARSDDQQYMTVCGVAGARSDDHKRATARVAPTVGDIVGVYKSLSVHHCLQWIKSNYPTFHMGKFWQRNYWEHIVRNDNELDRIRKYILQNPQKWETDKLNGGFGNMVMESSATYGDGSWMV